ncbi:MAG: tetratricopeptide repeat protein [Leptospirillia bacterium]
MAKHPQGSGTDPLTQALGLHQAGRLKEAKALYLQVLTAQPRHPVALHYAGILAHQTGHQADAVRMIRTSLEVQPNDANVWNNLGIVLLEMGDATAANAFTRAIRLKPDMADAHFNLGNAHFEQQSYPEAAAAFEQALRIAPDHAGAANNLGNTLRELGRLEEAVKALEQAARLAPDRAESHNNLASLYTRLSRYPEAEKAARRALELEPDHAEAMSHLYDIKRYQCDWDGIETLEAQMLGRADRGDGRIPAYLLLFTPATPAQILSGTRAYAQRKFGPYITAAHTPGGASRDTSPDGRITLGYLSADFRKHPVAQLSAGLFEKHDREGFRVIGYSYGPDDGSDIRARIRDGVDVFDDIRPLSLNRAAEKIRADGVDVLVDLTGYTGLSRSHIMALRPAPVQISFLGYAATAGAAFIDYIIADRNVIPEGAEDGFSEAPIFLPEAFMCTDDSLPITTPAPTRADCGLPEDGFVFACFNNSRKLSAPAFDLWMRLLEQVPGSVLWLSLKEPEAVAALKARAKNAGIDPARVINAGKVPSLGDHLARQQCADLFLDTWPYNAHTTTVDALWAGVPVLTCPGETFASRVAGSLLHAVGLGDMAVTSLAGYETRALALARNPAALAEVRKRLAGARLDSPLFNSGRFARHIEAGYRAAWARHLAGEPPAPITVEPLP